MSILALVAPSFVTFSTFFALCGAYVIAWLAGLVTPGAPAGVGVRELVLVVSDRRTSGRSKPIAGDSVLAVWLRWVGDFFYFLAALFIKSRATGFESNCR
ncbi:MAG: hypothetical protein U5J82_09410 [Desulfobacterales bacterium]|nr:hypothetical protein [Desulfobacterales bacterium]